MNNSDNSYPASSASDYYETNNGQRKTNNEPFPALLDQRVSIIVPVIQFLFNIKYVSF